MLKNSTGVNRRELMRAAALLAPARIAAAQPPSPATAAGAPAPLNRFPRMVQEYFVERVRRAEQTGLKRKQALKTRADAGRYVASVREKARQCFGPMPEKTPLNARVTGVLDRDAYRVEKVIFESRPGFLVTANLYVPKGRKFPLPGVVGCCGHSLTAKAAEPYQGFAQALARMGYVALVFDPLGQGERLQYLDAARKTRAGGTVGEHLLAGNQQALVGEFLGTWRAWDGIRALDYLLSRPEVDPKHVGVTGTSGGGTMATWLCALDPRWTMAAPSCFVTTFRRNVENELPTDPEQYPPKALALALDYDDFLAAMAPKPIVILANEKDYFDLRGAQEAYERLRRLYTLLGAAKNIALHVAPSPHGFSKENREGMYRWFNAVTGVSNLRQEPALELEEEQKLWCAPRGQVADLNSRTVFSFTRETSRRLAAVRSRRTGEPLEKRIRAALKLPAGGGVPGYRILRRIGRRGYPKPEFTTYAVETEPGIHALVYMLSEEPHYSRPPAGRSRAVLYIAHQSSDAELREEPLIRELLAAEPASAFFACDVRGIGESRPNTCGVPPYEPYGADYFYAGHSLMLDDSYAGQKTRDVLRVLDWLRATGHGEVHLAAKGWGAAPAAFAAVLSPLVTQVSLKNAPSSFAEIAESEYYEWPLSTFVPGVLESFDLPECYAALSAKKFRAIGPAGAVMPA